jgi:hypothetical protein
MPTGYDPLTGALINVARRKISASFTRPSNTTAYAAGDVVGPVTTAAVQTITGAARQNGGSGKIVGAILETNNATVTNGTFRVHVYNASFTPDADNAAFAGQHTNRAAYQGSFDFNILVADSASAEGAIAQLRAATDVDNGLPLNFECAAGNSALYCVIVALGAYVPASAQVFQLTLTVEQD